MSSIYKRDNSSRSLNIKRHILYFLIVFLIIFGAYKVFDWKKILDSDYESSKMSKREVVLPPFLKLASTTSSRVLSYDERLFLEFALQKLALQGVDVIQIEEAADVQDFALLTEQGYRVLINYKLGNMPTVDNIIGVYQDTNFSEKISSLEYIDFRFKDKVFFKVKQTIE